MLRTLRNHLAHKTTSARDLNSLLDSSVLVLLRSTWEAGKAASDLRDAHATNIDFGIRDPAWGLKEEGMFLGVTFLTIVTEGSLF